VTAYVSCMGTRLKERPGARAAHDEARWQATVARDASFEGAFLICVLTTRIYCRPGCPARRPRRENVIFADSAEAAERAGFRPCKRCRPDEPSLASLHAAKVTEACRTIETADAEPALNQLARSAGLSPHHFQRLFKTVTGVTPKAYALAHRVKRLRAQLEEKATVTEAIHSAGYNSAGRFYEKANEVLGMTPRQFRKGGAGETIRYAVEPCSLGQVLVAATDKGVCAILFGDSADGLTADLRQRFPHAALNSGDEDFGRIVASVVAFVEEPRRGLDLPLDIRGTAFQHRVWQELLKVPAGAIATYAEIAQAIGSPKASRAVGAACGANPIAVAVPCHRIVGSGGALTGYAGGLPRKRALLDREAKK
jgi:AraC family transcriptional regulator of adaptative response/methylated-DNA-[protein]-cysteine methyltransferase